jgi:hypothetical protein
MKHTATKDRHQNRFKSEACSVLPYERSTSIEKPTIMQMRGAFILALLASASAFSALPTARLAHTPLSKAAPRQSITRLFAESPAVPEQPVSGGTATITSEIFNLVKGIVGAGVLSLPAGEYQLLLDHG